MSLFDMNPMKRGLKEIVKCFSQGIINLESTNYLSIMIRISRERTLGIFLRYQTQVWSMFRPFHHILKSTRSDMRYIQRYGMRTCCFKQASQKFHWKVNSVFTKHSLYQQLYPQLFHEVEIFQITISICFTKQPFFGKAPSSFVTERKDNITFGKYSFSLRFLLFHFCFFLLPSCSLFCSLFYSWISTMF